MKRFFKAKITQDGKFVSDKDRFKRMCANIPPGDYLMLFIKQSNRTPRESQNYYFTQLGEWSLQTGYSKTELHDIVKHGLFVELFDGPVSSSELNEDMWDLVFLNLETFLITKFENS